MNLVNAIVGIATCDGHIGVAIGATWLEDVLKLDSRTVAVRVRTTKPLTIILSAN